MRINSIKEQTLVLLVSLTLCVGMLFSSLAVITAFVVEDSVISKVIDLQAKKIEQHYAQHKELPPLSDDSLKIFTDINTIPTWAQQQINSEENRGEVFTPDATHYHYQLLNLGTDNTAYLMVEASNLLVVTHQPNLVRVFIATFLIVILLAIFIASKFSRKIVTPILTLTDAIKRNEQLVIATPMPKLKYELGYLSAALQGSFDKLSATLEREKSFATNVSHELRTPLTVVKNSCALITQRGFTAEDLAQVTNACTQMENTVHVLLSLARAEHLATHNCNLIMALEQAILRCHTPALEHFHIDINIPSHVSVTSNSHLLSLLLENLFRNAVQHASEPKVTIAFADGKLIFENTTTYVPNLDITQAGTKGDKSEGLGQGLYLVARIAERLGWSLSVTTIQQQFRITINLA